MRVYLELIEVTEAEEADFIRIDVTEWSSEDIEEAVELLREHARAAYTSYILQKHYCHHDEGKQCAVDIVEAR
jgi:hypothetical protein